MRIFKNKYLLITGVVLLIVLFVLYKIDRKQWMKTRVKKTNWEYEKGYYIGDYIHPTAYKFSNDTLVFEGGKKCLLKYQYLNRLVITDLEGKNNGVYVPAMSSKDW